MIKPIILPTKGGPLSSACILPWLHLFPLSLLIIFLFPNVLLVTYARSMPSSLTFHLFVMIFLFQWSIPLSTYVYFLNSSSSFKMMSNNVLWMLFSYHFLPEMLRPTHCLVPPMCILVCPIHLPKVLKDFSAFVLLNSELFEDGGWLSLYPPLTETWLILRRMIA